MEFSSIINTLSSRLSSVATNFSRRNHAVQIECEFPDGQGRMLHTRAANMSVVGHGELSYDVVAVQLTPVNEEEQLRLVEIAAQFKRDILTFESFKTLEEAVVHAGIGMQYGHAFVEILAAFTGADEIIYGATASFYQPSLTFLIKQGQHMLALRFTQ